MGSRRHWTDLFKVNPSTPIHQGNEMNRHSILNQASATYQVGVAQYDQPKSRETKTRWNPKKEQIEVLESIYTSGKTNPSREEIQFIRSRLEEFGEVGDANVFYWFQNRKSKNRKRQRRLESTTENADGSSSSIYQSTQNITNGSAAYPIQTMAKSCLPTLPASTSLIPNQQIQQVQQVFGDPQINLQPPAKMARQGETFGEGTTSLHKYNYAISSLPHDYSQFLLPEEQSYPFNPYHHREAVISSALTDTTITRPDIKMGSGNEGILTVTIDGMKYQVVRGPINVKAAFGPNTMLVDSSCQPVLMNERGFTLQGLQEGANYYLIYKPGAGIAPLGGYSQV